MRHHRHKLVHHFTGRLPALSLLFVPFFVFECVSLCTCVVLLGFACCYLFYPHLFVQSFRRFVFFLPKFVCITVKSNSIILKWMVKMGGEKNMRKVFQTKANKIRLSIKYHRKVWYLDKHLTEYVNVLDIHRCPSTSKRLNIPKKCTNIIISADWKQKILKWKFVIYVNWWFS